MEDGTYITITRSGLGGGLQKKQLRGKNWGPNLEVSVVPRLCELHPYIYLKTEEKKNNTQIGQSKSARISRLQLSNTHSHTNSTQNSTLTQNRAYITILITGYRNVPLYKETVMHYCSGYVNWKYTCVMFTEPLSRSSWVAYSGRVLVVWLLTITSGLYTPISTPQIWQITLHSSAFQPLLHWPVSILQIFLYIYIDIPLWF
jgi:hypothetical protein